jgi:hypothetical protein
LPAWLQHGGFDVAVFDDGIAGVVAAVEADDDNVVLPAAFSAASAPSAMVSLPEITPTMSGLVCKIASIRVKASVWLQLAVCWATIFMSV